MDQHQVKEEKEQEGGTMDQHKEREQEQEQEGEPADQRKEEKAGNPEEPTDRRKEEDKSEEPRDQRKEEDNPEEPTDQRKEETVEEDKSEELTDQRKAEEEKEKGKETERSSDKEAPSLFVHPCSLLLRYLVRAYAWCLGLADWFGGGTRPSAAPAASLNSSREEAGEAADIRTRENTDRGFYMREVIMRVRAVRRPRPPSNPREGRGGGGGGHN